MFHERARPLTKENVSRPAGGAGVQSSWTHVQARISHCQYRREHDLAPLHLEGERQRRLAHAVGRRPPAPRRSLVGPNQGRPACRVADPGNSDYEGTLVEIEDQTAACRVPVVRYVRE